MKHDKHELTYKKFIKAEKRLNQIWKEVREQPYRELKEPYQAGWILIPTLRDDFMRSDKGPIVKGLIERFGKNCVVRSSKLISRIRKNPTISNVDSVLSSKGRLYRPDAPHIRAITKKEYDVLSEQQKKYFSPISPFLKAYRTGDYELNIPFHYIVIKIKKRIITHIQDINPILLKEEAELRHTLLPYWRGKNYGGYHWFENKKERRRSKVELTKIELEQE